MDKSCCDESTSERIVGKESYKFLAFLSMRDSRVYSHRNDCVNTKLQYSLVLHGACVSQRSVIDQFGIDKRRAYASANK